MNPFEYTPFCLYVRVLWKANLTFIILVRKFHTELNFICDRVGDETQLGAVALAAKLDMSMSLRGRWRERGKHNVVSLACQFMAHANVIPVIEYLVFCFARTRFIAGDYQNIVAIVSDRFCFLNVSIACVRLCVCVRFLRAFVIWSSTVCVFSQTRRENFIKNMDSVRRRQF